MYSHLYKNDQDEFKRFNKHFAGQASEHWRSIENIKINTNRFYKPLVIFGPKSYHKELLCQYLSENHGSVI